MTILTKASSLVKASGALRHHGIKAACKSTNTHVPSPAGIIDALQISRHIYEQEDFGAEDVTDSHAISPAEAALRTTGPHTSAASAGGGLKHLHGLLWSHWHPGPTAGVEYQTRPFSDSLRKHYAAIYDPSIWDWGDFSHIQPDHPIPPRPIMPGDEDYDPVTINDMPTHSEANVKADRSDIDPLAGHGPLWSHSYYHHHSHQSSTAYQIRQFSSFILGKISTAAVHDPSVWDWGFFSHVQPDHRIPPRPILPGDPHYDPVTINDMPSESEAIVKAERTPIDPLPMGLHRVILLPVGEALPEQTESEMDVRADRSPMEEDPLRRDRMRRFQAYGPLMTAGRMTEQEIKRDLGRDLGFGYHAASGTGDFSGAEMESPYRRDIYIREERLFVEDFGEEDESMGTSFGEGEGTEGYEGQRGYFGEEGPALRRRYGMEEMMGMDRSAEEMELEDAMLLHFTRFR